MYLDSKYCRIEGVAGTITEQTQDHLHSPEQSRADCLLGKGDSCPLGKVL